MSPVTSATILALMMLAAASPLEQRAAGQATDIPDGAPATCPVTRPPKPPFTPPPPYPAEMSADGFWLGTDKLWIALPTSGTWALGHYSPTDSAFRQKMLWYRKGFNPHTERPKLTVRGKRLDAPAPPLGVDGPNGAWTSDKDSFMTVGLNIPTIGCWEVTGNYGNDKLRFVVWVRDGTASASPGFVR